MALPAVKWRGSGSIAVPDKYLHSPRLVLWYKHGFSEALREFTPSENWIGRLVQDRPASEAYREGRRAAEALRS